MKGYCNYQFTSVHWAYRIPSHWKTIQGKRLATPFSGKEVVDEAALDGTYPVYGSGGPFKKTNLCMCSEVAVAFGRKGTIGKPIYIQEPFWAVDTMYYALTNKQMMSTRYLYYMLQVLDWKPFTTKTAIPSIVASDVFNAEFIVPPRAEQDQIVRYLDWQVSKINRLIAAKRKEIELLNAKRQRELSHVMQYGLNPHEPIQDTGIRWIGQAPRRWVITALKRCASLRSGITLGRQYLPGTKTISVPYLRVANVQTGYVDTSDIAYLDVTEEEAAQYQLPSGCVLMTEGGDRDKLGRGCVWDNSIYPCIHQNHVFAVTTNDELLCNRYLEYLSASDMGRMYFDITAIRTTNLACTNATKVLSFTFPLPERREQDRIIEYLDNLMAQYAKLISSIQRQISTLNDLRTRLISDVVTGQVDVRGIKVPEYETVEQTEMFADRQEDNTDEC